MAFIVGIMYATQKFLNSVGNTEYTVKSQTDDDRVRNSNLFFFAWPVD